jgi:hypothetical protein
MALRYLQDDGASEGYANVGCATSQRVTTGKKAMAAYGQAFKEIIRPRTPEEEKEWDAE